jgi:hypothetical protein
MNPSWRDAVLAGLGASRRRRVPVETLAEAVRRLTAGHLSDFEFQDRLLETLNALAGKGLPAPAESKASLGCSDRPAALRDGHSHR